MGGLGGGGAVRRRIAAADERELRAAARAEDREPRGRLVITALEDASLIVRKLGNVPVVCCAAPAYLARAGRPATPQKLAGHTAILDSNFREPGTWRFGKGATRVAVRVQGRSCRSDRGRS